MQHPGAQAPGTSLESDMNEEYELLLAQAKLSREDLSALSGVSRPTINKYLTGGDIRVSRHAALNAAFRVIQICHQHGSLPIERVMREPMASRRQRLLEAVALGVALAKAKQKVPQAEPQDVVEDAEG